MKINLSDFWELFSIPKPEEEYKFLKDRRFRFDYAWPLHSIAVEVEGGIWIGGRHNRPVTMIKDMEKYNLAALHGWKVFRFTPGQFKNGEAGEFLDNLFRQVIGIPSS